MLSKETIASKFKLLQTQICTSLEEADGKGKFLKDNWERAEGGGGLTRIIQNGHVIEKGGVNFSEVYGPVPELLKKEKELVADEFYATGVSIVMHPHNPFVPIIHMNVRYFELSDGTSWFGGGIDLTPHYIEANMAAFFHQELKQVCDKHSKAYYPKFKEWADNYFYIPHRNETRGVGGVFFDGLKEDKDYNKEDRFNFVMELGNSFAPLYVKFMTENKALPFNDDHKRWQLLRRGRYVEFNLVYDRGTRFGLLTNGRVESILMSLPDTASWQYDYNPTKGSKESLTLSLLKKGIDWTNFEKSINS